MADTWKCERREDRRTDHWALREVRKARSAGRDQRAFESDLALDEER